MVVLGLVELPISTLLPVAAAALLLLEETVVQIPGEMEALDQPQVLVALQLLMPVAAAAAVPQLEEQVVLVAVGLAVRKTGMAAPARLIQVAVVAVVALTHLVQMKWVVRAALVLSLFVIQIPIILQHLPRDRQP